MDILLVKVLSFGTLFNKRLALFSPNISAELFSMKLHNA